MPLEKARAFYKNVTSRLGNRKRPVHNLASLFNIQKNNMVLLVVRTGK